MINTAKISGWGGYPQQEVQLLTPHSQSELHLEVQSRKSLISRGMGRSYGDSANAPVVMQTTKCDNFIEFDPDTGILTAESGITMREILKVIVPKGWFLPVTPGTSFVTLGGAIASDVHGKNHHVAGTFGQHVKKITILLGTGEVLNVSPKKHIDLFQATCGGMGLTGVILRATIQLCKIQSSFINQKIIKADCIEATCEVFEANATATYSVAWIDCLAKGKNLGRSVLMLGEHANNGGLDLLIKNPINIPIYTPATLLNGITIKTFNNAIWHKAKHNKTQSIPLMTYFYPLDTIGAWNKIYGKAGFMQFQFVLPKTNGVPNMRKLLTEISQSGQSSFLAVLKQFGQSNENLLSFPTEGYSLALDFKMTPSIVKLLHNLENMVTYMGGRIYLSKDAVMRETSFKTSYPKWRQFEMVRQKYGAIGKFSSTQSKRLGLG